MDKWAVIEDDDGVCHVIPIGEMHEDVPTCQCKPRLDDGVWVHNRLQQEPS